MSSYFLNKTFDEMSSVLRGNKNGPVTAIGHRGKMLTMPASYSGNSRNARHPKCRFSDFPLSQKTDDKKVPQIGHLITSPICH
jgi:hypothetical protein